MVNRQQKVGFALLRLTLCEKNMNFLQALGPDLISPRKNNMIVKKK